MTENLHILQQVQTVVRVMVKTVINHQLQVPLLVPATETAQATVCLPML